MATFDSIGVPYLQFKKYSGDERLSNGVMWISLNNWWSCSSVYNTSYSIRVNWYWYVWSDTGHHRISKTYTTFFFWVPGGMPLLTAGRGSAG